MSVTAPEEFVFDVVIIGAGAIGLSIAAALSASKSVLVLESEKTFGQHTSSRNSEVIHSGIYYQKGTLKSELCIQGKTLLYDFLKKHDIEHQRCGKLIVATNNEEVFKLEEVKNNANVVGVEAEWLDGHEAESREENIKCVAALYVPDTGIFDSHSFMAAQKSIAEKNGAIVQFNSKVASIVYSDKAYLVSLENENFVVKSSILINSAGLFAGEISNMLGLSNYKVNLCKGEYFKTNKVKGLNHLIYPVPPSDGSSLGIHTRNYLDGSIGFGPSAYMVDEIDYSINNRYKEMFVREANRYLKKSLRGEDLFPDYTGIRPKFEKDFVIREESAKGFPGFINLIGIESPGLTSAIAIANKVAEMTNSYNDF